MFMCFGGSFLMGRGKNTNKITRNPGTLPQKCCFCAFCSFFPRLLLDDDQLSLSLSLCGLLPVSLTACQLVSASSRSLDCSPWKVTATENRRELSPSATAASATPVYKPRRLIWAMLLGAQNVWWKENVPENAPARKFLDPSKRSSGLLCRGFLCRKKTEH